MIKKILIGIVCLLVFPNIGKAAGNVATIDAKVINPNGAQTYDKDGNKQVKIIKSGETLQHEYDISETSSEYIKIKYINENFFVKVEDISLEEFDLKLLKEDKGKIYVYKENAKLYEGPSIYYKQIENVKIPVGTTLTYEYQNKNFLGNVGETWKYVEYKGKKGWMPTNWHPEAVAASVEQGSIISNGEITLYKEPKWGAETQKIEVPKNTIINYNVFHHGYGGGASDDFLYIEYNNYKGWVNPIYGFGAAHKFGQPNHQIYITLDSVQLVDYIESDNVISIIPVDETIKDKYIYCTKGLNCWHYTEYNGKKGWFFTNPDSNNVKFIGNASDDAEVPDKEDNNENNKVEIEVENNNEENSDDKSSKKIDSKMIIIISTISILVASIIGFITFKLINKKKNNVNNI